MSISNIGNLSIILEPVILIISQTECPGIVKPSWFTLASKDINAGVISSDGTTSPRTWNIFIERLFTLAALRSSLEKQGHFVFRDIVLVNCITGRGNLLVEAKGNNYLLLISTGHNHCSKWLQRRQLHSLRLEQWPFATLWLECEDVIGSIVIRQEPSYQKNTILASN